MRLSLDKENRFLAEDGKIDLRAAFRYAGIKAAWCYKPDTATPESIREMPESELIRMGMDTFINDHGTPKEHQEISVEIIGLPKVLCMILNDEHFSSACERSFRYTKVKVSDAISEIEIDLYNKWLKIFNDVLWDKYSKTFLMEAKRKIEAEKKMGAQNKTEADIEKAARTAARKIAQENARNFIGILVPTSIAYTTPWCEWQKIYVKLKDMVEHPRSDIERLAVPSAKELMKALVDNRIVVSTKEAVLLYPDVQEKIVDGRDILFKDNKHVKLALFGSHPEISPFDKPDEFGSFVDVTSTCSISSIGQRLRHRTGKWTMRELEEYTFITPPFIRGMSYQYEYEMDMMLVKGVFPQGQNVEVNMRMALEDVFNYVGKERACNRAQWETENWYVKELVPRIIKGLDGKPEYAKERQIIIKWYLDKCRCQSPDYNCPTPCLKPNPVNRPY